MRSVSLGRVWVLAAVALLTAIGHDCVLPFQGPFGVPESAAGSEHRHDAQSHDDDGIHQAECDRVAVPTAAACVPAATEGERLTAVEPFASTGRHPTPPIAGIERPPRFLLHASFLI